MPRLRRTRSAHGMLFVPMAGTNADTKAATNAGRCSSAHCVALSHDLPEVCPVAHNPGVLISRKRQPGARRRVKLGRCAALDGLRRRLTASQPRIPLQRGDSLRQHHPLFAPAARSAFALVVATAGAVSRVRPGNRRAYRLGADPRVGGGLRAGRPRHPWIVRSCAAPPTARPGRALALRGRCRCR